MLDFIIILAISYFTGIIPLAYFIKSQVTINIWANHDQEHSLGVMKIRQIAGVEAALALLVGYFIKGYLGLLLAQFLWGNNFINFPAATLLVLGQYYSHSSREADGIIPVLIGVTYCWDLNLGGILSALWLSIYLLTKRPQVSSLLTFSLWPLFFRNENVDFEFILFILISALLLFKNHILNKRASFNERRI